MIYVKIELKDINIDIKKIIDNYPKITDYKILNDN